MIKDGSIGIVISNIFLKSESINSICKGFRQRQEKERGFDRIIV
jgi:hypothetical protein